MAFYIDLFLDHFSSYINDLQNCLKYSKTYIFAKDDTLQ